MAKLEGTLNAKLRDKKYKKRFEKDYVEFKSLVDSWQRLIVAGDDIVSAIEKYGGKWDGPSHHMRFAIKTWIELCGKEATVIRPVDPKDLPQKRSSK